MKTVDLTLTLGNERVTGTVSVHAATSERDAHVAGIYERAKADVQAYLSIPPDQKEHVPTHFEVSGADGLRIADVTVQFVGNFNDTQITNADGWIGTVIPKPGSMPFSVFFSKDGYEDLQLHEFPWDGRPHQSGGDPGAYRILLRKIGQPPTGDLRKGPVRADGRATVDDAGAFLTIGASAFAIPYLLEFEPERANANLEFLRDEHVHAPRVLCVVGPEEPWADRAINPKTLGWPRWTSMIRQTLVTMRGWHQRAILTIFGSTDGLGRVERQRVVSEIRQIIRDHRHQVLGVEVSNEAKVSYEEALEHVRMLLVGNDGLLVATTAMGYGHSGWDAVENMNPWHHARKTTGDGGIWEYTEQPYKGKDSPRVISDQEHIGPKSSVAEDSDPERLTSSAATSFVTGHAIVVLHTGAGVFMGGSGGDSRGREANLFDVPGITTMLRARVALASRMPADLPNWRNTSHSDPSREGDFPWKTSHLQPFNPGGWFLKIYAARHADGRFAANFMKVEQDIVLEPGRGRSQEFTIYPCVGDDHEDVRLKVGERTTVQRRGGFYIVGREV